MQEQIGAPDIPIKQLQTSHIEQDPPQGSPVLEVVVPALLLEELGQPTLVLLVEAGLDELELESSSTEASAQVQRVIELPPLEQLQVSPIKQPPQESVAAVLEAEELEEALMQPMVVA
jgi:hypothetical protein